MITSRDDARQVRGAGPGPGKASRSPPILLANVLVSLLRVHMLSRPPGLVPDRPGGGGGPGQLWRAPPQESALPARSRSASLLPLPHARDLGSLPAGVGLPARVFSLPKGADLWFPLRVTSGGEGLAPREGGQMTQLFPQPRGAGSSLHSSMGAPGKGPAPRPGARGRSRVAPAGRVAGLACPSSSAVSSVLPLCTPAASPFPSWVPTRSSLSPLLSHPTPGGSQPLLPCLCRPVLTAPGEGCTPGSVAGSPGEDRWGSDLSRGCTSVGESLDFSVRASVRPAAGASLTASPSGTVRWLCVRESGGLLCVALWGSPGRDLAAHFLTSLTSDVTSSGRPSPAFPLGWH